MVRCRTFNVIGVVFFSDISWFTVESFILSLSLEVWYLLARYSLGDQAPTSHNTSQGSLDPRETTFVRHYLSLSLSHCPIVPHAYLTVRPSSDYPTFLCMTHGSILLFGSFIPTIIIFWLNYKLCLLILLKIQIKVFKSLTLISFNLVL